MVLKVIRGLFLVIVAAVAALYLLGNQTGVELGFYSFVSIMIGALVVAGVVVAADAGTQRKRLSALSGVFLGLVAGLLAAYALSFVVDLIGLLTAPQVTTPAPEIKPGTAEFLQQPEIQRDTIRNQFDAHQAQASRREAFLNLLEGVKVFIGLITCYLGISLVLQTKDDFRFVIPYVEFSKETRGSRPMLVDTSVLVDGRVVDIVNTRIIQGTLIVPQFVLTELQTLADSSDRLRRARGRRGLDILSTLQNDEHAEVVIEEHEVEAQGVDHKLIELAQRLRARLMTNDYNLNKLASVRGIEVINLNDLAKALRPVVLPGEQLDLELIKPGESPGQGVGYLDDGTMVVVEGGADHLKHTVRLTVTSTLQTSAGRMLFGRCDGRISPAAQQSRSSQSDQPTASESTGKHAATHGPATGESPAGGKDEHAGSPPAGGSEAETGSGSAGGSSSGSGSGSSSASGAGPERPHRTGGRKRNPRRRS